MPYVDGFLLPLPKKNLKLYRRMAQQASKIWRQHGALEFRECVGDDLKPKMGAPFPRTVRLKSGETVLFWNTHNSAAFPTVQDLGGVSAPLRTLLAGP